MEQMQPLEFKYIDGEKHLAFNSIRGFVFQKLSKPSAKRARLHLRDCYRCRSIHESLARPGRVRRKRSNAAKSMATQVLSGSLLVIILMAVVGALLYFGGTSNTGVKNLSEFRELSTLFIDRLLDAGRGNIGKLTPLPPRIGPTENYQTEIAAYILPEIPATSAVTTTGRLSYANSNRVEGPPVERVKAVYGRITAEGAALKGVTVMIPGGSTAQISDSSGRYQIDIPPQTGSLVFIYRGKQLEKSLNPKSARLDIELEVDQMIYPGVDPKDIENNNLADF